MASINKTLIDALSTIGSTSIPVFPDYYDGSAQEYIVFSYSRRPSFGADNYPYVLIYDINIDYVAPPKKNVLAIRDGIMASIFSLLGTYPDETNASTDTEQHYVYEFELDGDVIL